MATFEAVQEMLSRCASVFSDLEQYEGSQDAIKAVSILLNSIEISGYFATLKCGGAGPGAREPATINRQAARGIPRVGARRCLANAFLWLIARRDNFSHLRRLVFWGSNGDFARKAGAH